MHTLILNCKDPDVFLGGSVLATKTYSACTASEDGMWRQNDRMQRNLTDKVSSTVVAGKWRRRICINLWFDINENILKTVYACVWKEWYGSVYKWSVAPQNFS